jgi:hypothetical protein
VSCRVNEICFRQCSLAYGKIRRSPSRRPAEFSAVRSDAADPSAVVVRGPKLILTSSWGKNLHC